MRNKTLIIALISLKSQWMNSLMTAPPIGGRLTWSTQPGYGSYSGMPVTSARD